VVASSVEDLNLINNTAVVHDADQSAACGQCRPLTRAFLPVRL
jgi:hypothetical protein